MTISIRKLREFLLFKYSKIERMALFEREATTLFHEFRQWYRDNHYNKVPHGVTLKIFNGWLKKLDVIVVSKSNRKTKLRL